MMRRLGPSTVALCLALLSGVALGVPRSSRDPLASLGQKADEAAPPAPPAPLFEPPKTPFEVEITIKKYDDEEKRIQAELDAIAAELAVVDERVVFRGKAYFKQVRAGLLPAGGGFDELVDHAARVERTRLALTRDLDAQRTLRKRQDALEARLTRLKGERAPLDMQREVLSKAKGLLRQADERRQAFERAFDSSTPPPDHISVYGADTGPTDPGSASFASLFGRLPLPVAGRAEVRKLEATAQSPPALEIRAPEGATARAVGPGRIVFADVYQDDALRQRDESITVVVDHGERHFSTYANLQRADVKVGEAVPQNAPLGRVATRGAEGAVLYFELRKNGLAVEPGPWFGL